MNTPPHNIEAEAGIIGCLLADTGDGYQEAVAAGLKRDWFYDLRHALVFKAIEALELEGTPANLQTLRKRLEPTIEDAGGISYLIHLQSDATPSPAFLPIWMGQCRDSLLKRKAASIAAQAADQIGGSADGEGVLNAMAESCVAAIDSTTQKESEHGAALAGKLTNSLERRKTLADAGQRSGIPSGFRKLDEMTDGLQAGEQFIIGARPSAGKTAMGLTITADIAIRQSIPTLIISCEMSTESLLTRLCSVCTGISLSDLRYGRYRNDDMKKLLAFNAKIAAAPLYIFDAISGITGEQASATIRQHARRHGVKFALVDYLQKLRPDKKSEKRTYEVAEVSQALRSAAVRSNVALLTLAQLSREPDKGNEPRMPRLSDLADSAQIERDADTIALIHRDSKIISKASLIIAKQRDGQTGFFDMYFNGPLTRFEDADTQPSEDI